MNIRTDLAIEKEEFITGEKSAGIVKSERTTEKTRITEIEIKDGESERKIGKPVGRYITVEMDELSYDSELLDDRLTSLSNEIKKLLPKGEDAVLVVGIGNESITPDALGPRCARLIFSTRHIDSKLKREIGLENLNPVCALATGVLGQTGIETGEIIKSVSEAVKPKAVIVIDALAAAQLNRLGKTVQLTDTGITPGSGVGNSRAEISEKTLGVPVIAVGIPTVVDAVTLTRDITKTAEFNENGAESENMIVTPREIDTVIDRAARLLALAVNCALQPDIEPELLLSVV